MGRFDNFTMWVADYERKCNYDWPYHTAASKNKTNISLVSYILLLFLCKTLLLTASEVLWNMVFSLTKQIGL